MSSEVQTMIDRGARQLLVGITILVIIGTVTVMASDSLAYKSIYTGFLFAVVSAWGIGYMATRGWT